MDYTHKAIEQRIANLEDDARRASIALSRLPTDAHFQRGELLDLRDRRRAEAANLGRRLADLSSAKP